MQHDNVKHTQTTSWSTHTDTVLLLPSNMIWVKHFPSNFTLSLTRMMQLFSSTPVIRLDFFKHVWHLQGSKSNSWKLCQIITVPGQIHCHPYCSATRATLVLEKYTSSTRKDPAPFPVSHFVCVCECECVCVCVCVRVRHACVHKLHLPTEVTQRWVPLHSHFAN